MRESVKQELDEIYKLYDFREELGSGNFGTVRLAVNRISGEAVAIKIFQKKKKD
jgi:serine/threonine protein kinase